MPNLTIAIPKKLHSKMRKHREVKWSEVIRRAISDHLRIVEESGSVNIEELREFILGAGESIDEISVERAIEQYRKMGELEWKRTSMTRA
ncbi:MAG: hypothetical protein QXQ11_06460 [Candidatus Bathyarchaeia archaeon]|nr:hypothetical protein [Candidatus Bathyarchaeota archaeon]